MEYITIRPWDEKKQIAITGPPDEQIIYEPQQPVVIKNKKDAERIAKVYINDDNYLRMDRMRMISICHAVIKYDLSPETNTGISKILEVITY